MERTGLWVTAGLPERSCLHGEGLSAGDGWSAEEGWGVGEDWSEGEGWFMGKKTGL